MALATTLLLPSLAHADWILQYGSSADDGANGVATDAADNVFSGGETKGGIFGETALGSGDGYVAKWDASGSLQWGRILGTSSLDLVTDLAPVGASSVAAAGVTSGSLPTFTNQGGFDAMVRLYDSAGNTTWTRQFGTSGNEELNAVAASGSSYLYVSGYTNGTFPSNSNAGLNDVFVSQLNAATGAINWTFQIGSTANDSGHGLAADALGNVYLGGQTAGTLPGQISLGGFDAFVLKLNVSGTLQWTRQFGTTGGEGISDLAFDSTGALLAVGATSGTLPGQTTSGGTDAFVRKFDTDGNTLWTHQFGTSATDTADGVAVDGDDQVIVGGQTAGTFPGETTPNATPDAFVRVLTAAGTPVFTNQYGGSTTTRALDVAVDSVGRAYLVGDTGGTIIGQTSAGGNDAFLIQVSVPEPGTATFLLGGLTLLGLRRRRV